MGKFMTAGITKTGSDGDRHPSENYCKKTEWLKDG